MKAVILAGGKGTRLQEETVVRPKPMVEIGGKPVLWHIMKIYAAHGVREFVICLGYKGELIKDYFLNYRYRRADLTIDLGSGDTTLHDGASEDWRVHLVDTGLDTMTGGRLLRARRFIGDEPFFMTYGDGVADVDLDALLATHRRAGRHATVSAVRAPARFGNIVFEGEQLTGFQEKAQTEAGWINGGFFVLEPEALDYVPGDDTIWEREPLEGMLRVGQLNAYRHDGYWQCMDTLRDVQTLEQAWQTGDAPWARRWA